MMIKGIRGFLVITSASLLGACAAQGPTANNAAAPVAKADAAPRAIPAKGDADKAAGATVPTSGYRKVVKDGVEYFCSRDGYTGSRVDNSVKCLTKEQLAAVREGAQDMMRRQQGHVGQVSSEANPGGAPYSAAQPRP
jgi:hypothetical protein